MNVHLTSAPNFRDLGGVVASDGRVVRSGQVFRSARLDQFSDPDRAYLDELGVALVIDLRSTFEVENDGPGHLPVGARRLHCPIGDEPGAAPIMRARSPIELLGLLDGLSSFDWARRGAAIMATTPTNHDRWSRAIHAIADEGTPVVFHCRAGKDRTGWLAACILGAVGVGRDEIMADYLESNVRLRGHWDTQLDALEAEHPEADRSLIEPLMSVHEDYLNHAWDQVDAEFGSFDAYLSAALRVDPSVRARLAAALLEAR